MHVVAVLADGQRAVPGRRLRPLLRLRAREVRVRDQPLHHGGEAPARRAGPEPRRAEIPDRRRVHDRRHRDLPVVRRAGARQHLRRGGLPRSEVLHQRGALGVGDPEPPCRQTRPAREQALGTRERARARAALGE